MKHKMSMFRVKHTISKYCTIKTNVMEKKKHDNINKVCVTADPAK
jgi:hypothetical protein